MCIYKDHLTSISQSCLSFLDEFQQLLAMSQGKHFSTNSSDDDLTTVDETSEPSSSEYDEDLPPRVPNRKSYMLSPPPIKDSDISLPTGDDPLYSVIKE